MWFRAGEMYVSAPAGQVTVFEDLWSRLFSGLKKLDMHGARGTFGDSCLWMSGASALVYGASFETCVHFEVAFDDSFTNLYHFYFERGRMGLANVLAAAVFGWPGLIFTTCFWPNMDFEPPCANDS